MNKKDLMYYFLSRINNNNYMPIFLKNIFDYNNITKNNYISRCTKEDNKVILDVYDNISDNRFNRYVFIFNENKNYYYEEINNVFVHYIYVNNIDSNNNNNKLLKFAYLFNITNNNILEYANNLLDNKLIMILKKGINHK